LYPNNTPMKLLLIFITAFAVSLLFV